jgi:hypothetical protein
MLEKGEGWLKGKGYGLCFESGLAFMRNEFWLQLFSTVWNGSMHFLGTKLNEKFDLRKISIF